jgi:hypothetical protein
MPRFNGEPLSRNWFLVLGSVLSQCTYLTGDILSVPSGLHVQLYIRVLGTYDDDHPVLERGDR